VSQRRSRFEVRGSSWVRRSSLVATIVLMLSGAGAAQPRDVAVKTTLSQTAVWVADRVIYTITIACSKGVDILADDLSKDKLHAEGLEILGSDSNRNAAATGETTYIFRYILTTYRVDVPDLKLAPMTVRYYVKRAGQRIGDAAPAGEVQVPAASIAFRSALPEGQDTFAIRDGRDPRPRRLRYVWLQPVGLALILISIVPAAVAAIAFVRRTRPREKPRSVRQVQHDERATLEALRALDVSTPAGRRDAYSRVDALVRDHLRARTGVDAAGLTPPEIETELGRRNGRMPIALVASILASCDAARYAPADRLPSADDCRTAIDEVAGLIER
jgi:hypothetical protein